MVYYAQVQLRSSRAGLLLFFGNANTEFVDPCSSDHFIPLRHTSAETTRQLEQDSMSPAPMYQCRLPGYSSSAGTLSPAVGTSIFYQLSVRRYIYAGTYLIMNLG